MPDPAGIARRLAALLTPVAALPLLRGPAPAEAAPAPSLAALVQQLEAQPALRDGFARDPQGALRAAGIDPAVFDIGASLSPAQMEALLARWRDASGLLLVQAKPPETPPARSGPPVAVYGPPPGPSTPGQSTPGPQTQVPPVPPPDAGKPPPLPPSRPGPPAPVYGPPPGLR